MIPQVSNQAPPGGTLTQQCFFHHRKAPPLWQMAKLKRTNQTLNTDYAPTLKKQCKYVNMHIQLRFSPLPPAVPTPQVRKLGDSIKGTDFRRHNIATSGTPSILDAALSGRSLPPNKDNRTMSSNKAKAGIMQTPPRTGMKTKGLRWMYLFFLHIFYFQKPLYHASLPPPTTKNPTHNLSL